MKSRLSKHRPRSSRLQQQVRRQLDSRWNVGSKNVRAAYVLSYLVIMFVVLMMVTPMLLWGLTSIRDEALALKRTKIENTLRAMEDEIASYHNQVEAMKSSIIQVASYEEPFSAPEIYQLLEQKQQVNQRIIERQYVHDALILYENGMLVTATYTFSDSDYFNEYYRRDEGGDIERPITRLRNNVQSQVVGTTWYGEAWSRGDGEGTFLEYTIPVRSNTLTVPAYFILVLDLDAFYSNLSELGVTGVVLRSNQGGSLMLGDPTDERNLDLYDETPSDNDLVISNTSRLLNLSFSIRIDDQALGFNMRDMGVLLFSYLNLIILAGIGISFILSRRQIRPIEEIYAAVTQSTGLQRTLGFEDIKQSIDGLHSSIVQYQARIKTLRDSRNTSAFERLLWGIDKDWPEDVDDAFRESIQHETFRLAIFTYSSQSDATMPDDETNVLTEAVTEIILHHRYRNKLYIHPVKSDCFVALMPDESMGLDHAKRYWASILQEVRQTYGLELSIAFSKVCHSPSEIRDAYSMVRGYRFREGENLVFCEEIQSDVLRIASSVQLGKIRDSLLEGRSDVSDLIRELWDEAAPTTQDEQAQLYYSTKNTLDNACRQLPAELQPTLHFELLESQLPMEKVINALADYAQMIAAAFQEVRQSYKNPVIGAVMQYLEENYDDPDLYGKSISDTFNISEKYFFTLFKSSVGISFSDYLMQLRLKEATRLLVEKGITIAEIAERVGYRSADTFSKAYKRTYGMTPGQVRRSTIMDAVINES